MALSGVPEIQGRRHGAELQTALLDAACDELVEQGYDAFTIDAVAVRERPSRAGLYRRCPPKPDPGKAAIASPPIQQSLEIPDTGTIRGGLIAFMRLANGSRAQQGLVLITRLGAFFSDAGTSLTELRRGLVQAR